MKTLLKKKRTSVKKSPNTKEAPKKKMATAVSSSGPAHKLFPIVVIGASAGGLEAETRLIKNLSPRTGMAYVIIHHSSPDYKSYLKTILQRETKIEVIIIKNGMSPMADKIYVAPPAYSATISGGIFHLTPRIKVKKPYLAIDIFMRSLSEDNKHFNIGVILSGTDSDGVIGMGYIKTGGGITFAQDAKSSKFPDMPRNSIIAGVVDFVLTPEGIARELNRLGKNVYLKEKIYTVPDEILSESQEHVSKILNMLKIRKNVDFKLYKPTTVRRRILRRMLMNKIYLIKDYVKFFTGNFEEIDALCADILINVTSFFRDPEMYLSLKKNVFPKILKKKKPGDSIRIWVTACSTGEEAYSMAIALIEFLGKKLPLYKIQIFSTDLSDIGIQKARKGVYPLDISNDVSPERLRKFFVKVNDRYQINKNIRELCVFARQNLVQDPPFSKIDLISCRNVLIYLGPGLQSKVIPTFHYALESGGFLVLGTAETVGAYKQYFEVIDKKNRIYLKNSALLKNGLSFNKNIEFSPNNLIPIQEHILPEFKKETDSVTINRHASSGVIINKDLEVVLVKGEIQQYLEMPQGQQTSNIIEMASGELQTILKFLTKKIFKNNKTVRQNDFTFESNGQDRIINVVIEPLKNYSKEEILYFVFFEEVQNLTTRKVDLNTKTSKEISSLQTKELATVTKKLADNKEYLQSVVEQQETTNEELRSANEEIQSSNEELQSSNEELETTKEELQSTNEELTTVNEELQDSNLELYYVNNDLNNLLNSIKISTLIIDNNLKIKRYTKESSKLLNIIPSDVGRKITDINPNLIIPDLKKLIKEVMDSLQFREINVQDRDKKCWYTLRIKPYKTLENKIDGVIITFIDITDITLSLMKQKEQQKQVLKLNNELETRVEDRTFELATMNKDLRSEVTDRKNMENSLRILSQNLIDTQEKERLKLSRELHDSVNQILSVAKLKAHTAEQQMNSTGKTKLNLKYIADTKNYIEKAIEEVRRLSYALRPSALIELGITAALHSMTDEFKERTHIDVEFKDNKIQKKVSDELQLTLYRIVQEGLQNIAKHSKATNVKIEISQGKDQIHLSISDNGRGFVYSQTISHEKDMQQLGLLGIKERAESIGGKLIIKTERGLGTLIKVSLPLNFKKNVKS
ncbi:MAG: CheR family methyltransferase [Ignavibacteria bacterium]